MKLTQKHVIKLSPFEENIVDTKGTLVLEKTIEVKNGINMYPVNQKWSPGVYFISISKGQNSTPILRHSIH